MTTQTLTHTRRGAPARQPQPAATTPRTGSARKPGVAANAASDVFSAAACPSSLRPLGAIEDAGAPAPVAGQAAWISATRFVDATQTETLSGILRVVEETARRGGPAPVVVFDLDGTLFGVEGRVLHVLQMWLDSPEGRAAPAEIRSTLCGLGVRDTWYSPKLSLQRAGIAVDEEPAKAVLASLQSFFNKEFYEGEHLADDESYPGAAAFTRALHDAGASIVYLTGRPEPSLGEGTRSALEREGFPMAERARLMMKPSLSIDDLEFKTKAFQTIEGLGKVVATVENEPANAVAFATRFPTAMNVYIETTSSDRGAVPGDGLYRIKDYVGLPHPDLARG